jgi:hypothetical protein
MKKKTENKKPPKIAGTNKYDIPEEKVEQLASRFWSNTEIAAFFNVSTKTITNHFSNILTKGRENGKGKLRDLQLRAANNGNVTMLIWLGKQYLGQTDKQELYSETVNEVKFID